MHTTPYPDRPLVDLLGQLAPTEQPVFMAVLQEVAAMPDYLTSFDRLTGANLSRRGAPIELAIDEASGRLDAELRQFAGFVHDIVWLRWPADSRPTLLAHLQGCTP